MLDKFAKLDMYKTAQCVCLSHMKWTRVELNFESGYQAKDEWLLPGVTECNMLFIVFLLECGGLGPHVKESREIETSTQLL